MNVRPLLALFVFALDLWALHSLFSARTRPHPSRQLAWTAVIVFIPLIGAALWLRARRDSTGISRAT